MGADYFLKDGLEFRMEENWTVIEQTSLKVETCRESKITHTLGTLVQLLAQAERCKQAVCSDDVFLSIF